MLVLVHRRLSLALSFLALGIVAGCSLLSGDKVDYAGNAKRTQPLEVPPDLTQLARENRYLPQVGGSVSASSYAAQPAAAAAPGTNAPPATAATVAAPAAAGPATTTAAGAAVAAPPATTSGAARIEGAGTQRRIVTPLTREQLWPQLQSYWQDLGFTLARDDIKTGVIETDWTDLRNTARQKEGVLGMLRSLFASGERDKFSTRVEATATGTAIYLAHQSTVAVYANASVVDPKLEPRPADPEVEAKYMAFMLQQLNKSMPAALARPTDSVAPVLSAAPQSARLPELGVAAAAATVLPVADRARIESRGSQRWVVTPASREELWPRLRNFWEDLGFKLVSDKPEQGEMETDWVELRSTKRQASGVSGFLSSIFSTGQREKFSLRVEATATGNEIHLSHRSAAQVFANSNVVEPKLEPQPGSPQLEAEYLAFLVEQLNKAPAAPPPPQAAPAAAAPVTVPTIATAAAPASPAPVAVAPERARMVGDAASTIEIDDSFDRAWRRVGIALDRAGFTVEDRDRAGGLYFVRYIDPKAAKQEGPGFFSRLFGAGKAPSNQPARYRIALESTDAKTAVSVRSAPGVSDDGSTRRTIAARLLDELKK